MEVRPGQHRSTIAQACAHNISTIERDMDMFEALLRAEDAGRDVMEDVTVAHAALKVAYDKLLGCFEAELTHDVLSGRYASEAHGHEHVKPVDRDVVTHAVESVVHAAERFETR
ncbi:MAG: hypothetical protein ACREMY_16265 [bacterium]